MRMWIQLLWILGTWIIKNAILFRGVVWIFTNYLNNLIKNWMRKLSIYVSSCSVLRQVKKHLSSDTFILSYTLIRNLCINPYLLINILYGMRTSCNGVYIIAFSVSTEMCCGWRLVGDFWCLCNPKIYSKDVMCYLALILLLALYPCNFHTPFVVSAEFEVSYRLIVIFSINSHTTHSLHSSD